MCWEIFTVHFVDLPLQVNSSCGTNHDGWVMFINSYTCSNLYHPLFFLRLLCSPFSQLSTLTLDCFSALRLLHAPASPRSGFSALRSSLMFLRFLLYRNRIIVLQIRLIKVLVHLLFRLSMFIVFLFYLVLPCFVVAV